ncbi:MAG: hypothetical protein M1826_000393 [Phylliscum demangeonii]|nr:MAG: hypothetical protein M1826_000393 [Phylliscum demangeonii]
MVFKPFTHLARQNFVKSFTHGYAQTFVAASQTSHLSNNSPFSSFTQQPVSKYKKPLPRPNVSQSTSDVFSSPSARISFPGSTADADPDGGLTAYLAAWQQHQQAAEGQDEGDWKQYQFSRRIGWKAPSTAKEDKAFDAPQPEDVTHDLGRPDGRQLERPTLRRAQSTPTIEQDREKEAKGGRGTPIKEIIARDAPVASPLTATEKPTFNSFASRLLTADAPADVVAVDASNLLKATALQTSIAGESHAIRRQSSQSNDASTTQPPTDAASQAYVDHIRSLQANGSYREIPAVFQAMLQTGITPSADAYNGLLSAAINITSGEHDVVTKVLDIYGDMQRRHVAANTTTYATVLDIVAARAIRVSKSTQLMSHRRARYAVLGNADRFLLASHGPTYAMLLDDNTYRSAIKIFEAVRNAPSQHTLSLDTYRLLMGLCAEHADADRIINVFVHMEAAGVTPSADIFTSMITCFARSGRLDSAVECYQEYKKLAMTLNERRPTLQDRMDEQVYAALIRAYIICGETDAADRFFNKVQTSYATTAAEYRQERLDVLYDLVVPRAFVDELARRGLFQEALRRAETSSVSPAVRHESLARICISAADRGALPVASDIFDRLSPSHPGHFQAAVSMMALHLRLGNLQSAAAYWGISLADDAHRAPSFVEPGSMYLTALLIDGRVEEAVTTARGLFRQIRAAATQPAARKAAVDAIDESVECMGRLMRARGIVPSASASMELMWTMVDNGGLVPSIAEQLLAGLGPEAIAALEFTDMILALRVQAGMISKAAAAPDMANRLRFTELFTIAIASGSELDRPTSVLIEGALAKLGSPELTKQWQDHHQVIAQQTQSTSAGPSSHPMTPVSATSIYDDSIDPYGASTDYRTSSFIADELEKRADRSGTSRLENAMTALKSIRRSGRHARYTTYAKLISAAARENRAGLTQELLDVAKADLPYLPHYRVVKQGWVGILDAMVGACLTLGDRDRAMQHHRELADMGAAPSANTFGLYITTLKESTKTSDEATEALKIFRRAKAEGVEPSPFLYNALIGKLGRARRIDDCLYFFSEMRQLGIRPTSVTYGTIVNALCRVSDEKYAEELFEEMESMSNYKPRPAPYNSLMQFFLTTKRDRGKVLAYYDRMRSKEIRPTSHTFKLLVDSYASLEPVDMASAEAVLGQIHDSGLRPEAVHYASLIHAKGCILQDLDGARQIFDDVVDRRRIKPHACLYQALLESMVANHQIADVGPVLDDMRHRGVEMTAYIANSLIHGWALQGDVSKAKAIYDAVGLVKREPSTYEAMTRAFLLDHDRDAAAAVVHEMSRRGYPTAVVGKVTELVGLKSVPPHEPTPGPAVL